MYNFFYNKTNIDIILQYQLTLMQPAIYSNNNYSTYIV